MEDKTYYIELQVKKKASEITYDEFATWLSHFQKRQIRLFHLDKDIKNILRMLCENGYIYKERITNEIYFLHPIYTYASKLLLQEEIEADWDIKKYIKYMRRAIG